MATKWLYARPNKQVLSATHQAEVRVKPPYWLNLQLLRGNGGTLEAVSTPYCEPVVSIRTTLVPHLNLSLSPVDLHRPVLCKR